MKKSKVKMVRVVSTTFVYIMSAFCLIMGVKVVSLSFVGALILCVLGIILLGIAIYGSLKIKHDNNWLWHSEVK